MKRAIKHIIWTIAFCFIFLMNVQQAEAASTKNTTGTCEYDNAYEVLDIVNRKRAAKGMQELVMDQDLLDAAMLRAAELSVSFSHTRPNNTDWYTACSKTYAENIAYGYGTPAAVMQGWMTSKQGHKENIMNEDYCAIGVGVFYKGGVRYWVQCFSLVEADEAKKIDDVKRTYKVSLTSGKETTIVNTNPLSTKVKNFKATAGKRKLTLKWKKKTGIDGYQLQISTSSNYKKKQTYNIGKSKTKKVITKYNGKKLKAKKKYYVRIRAYKKVTNADGSVTKKYSKWKKISKKTK